VTHDLGLKFLSKDLKNVRPEFFGDHWSNILPENKCQNCPSFSYFLEIFSFFEY